MPTKCTSALWTRQGQKLVHCNLKHNDFAYFLKLAARYAFDAVTVIRQNHGLPALADAS